MIRAAIFDVDGTLIDSVDLHARAWQQALAAFGHHIPFPDVRHQIGKGGDQLLPVFLSDAELKGYGARIEELRQQIYKREYLHRVQPFPKVRDLFLRLRRDGIRTVLASSAKDDEVNFYKEACGISDLVEARTSKDDVERSKPDPDIFAAALDRIGDLDSLEVIAIGDTPYDAEAAGKLGIATIGVLCGGFSEHELLGAGCAEIYRDPADLLLHYDESAFSARTAA